MNKATKQNNLGDKIYRFFKRLFDIIFSLMGIILLIPLTIVLFFVRKYNHDDDAPIFYEQLRYGKDGKVFRLYKYRSMCINADDILEDYLNKNIKNIKNWKMIQESLKVDNSLENLVWMKCHNS